MADYNTLELYMQGGGPSLKWPKMISSEGYRGLYINLDRASVRRRRMEDELRRFGHESVYVRLPAFDGGRRLGGNATIKACFESHLAAIDMARTARMPVHIIEDDVTLTRHVAPFIEWATATGLLDRFDLLFLDMWVDPDWQKITRYNDLFRQAGDLDPPDLTKLAIADMSKFRIGAAASYVVNPRGAAKLHRFLRKENRRDPGRAVDSTIGNLVQKHKLSAGIVVPFLTGIDPGTGRLSDIQIVGAEEMDLFLLLRRAFFVETDLEADILPRLEVFRAKGRFDGLDAIRDLLLQRMSLRSGADSPATEGGASR